MNPVVMVIWSLAITLGVLSAVLIITAAKAWTFPDTLFARMVGSVLSLCVAGVFASLAYFLVMSCPRC